MEIRKRTLGEKHPDYANSLHNLAGVAQEVGPIRKGQAARSAQATEIKKKALGARHSSYAASLHGSCGTNNKMGEYAEAKASYLQVIQIHEQTLNPTHPDYAQD